MKKQIITFLVIFVTLFSVDLTAQNISKVKVPVQHGKTHANLRWLESTPLLSSNFKTSIVPFKLPKNYSLDDKNIARSVGDGTNINGCVIYADDWTDANMHYGMYSLEARRGFAVNPIAENENMKSTAAGYAKGKYYVFNVTQIFGNILGISCRIYNADTWEEENGFDNERIWNNVPITSLAYDVVSDKAYALTFGSGPEEICLSAMNLENGTFEKVCTVSQGYYTLSSALDGTFYAISEDGSLYKIEKDGTETYIGSTGLSPKHMQSAACDPATGKLYWAFKNATDAALYEVNTQTATAYKIDDMPNGEEIIGVYIEAPEVKATAPASVTELKFTPNAEGSLTGTLSCVAPLKNQKGDNLSGTLKVALYSEMNKILEETVTCGTTVKKENYTFNANELYTIYAIASNNEGSSPKQSITVYVGKDVASAPTDVVLSINDKQATLKWNAPTKGLNDGYIDLSQVSYKIVRHVDGDQGTLIGTTEPGATTYMDKLPDVTAKYCYAITPIYDGKEGGTALSNQVVSAGVLELPFYDEFDDGEWCNSLYTYLDLDQDGHDNMSEWFWKEDEQLMQFCADNEHVGNDWLITPAIHLDGKNLYDLEFSINMGEPSNLRVTIGTSTDPKDHQVIMDLNNIYESSQSYHSATIKAPKDGNYYIGFYAYSGLESFYLNLFDIRLEAGQSTDVPDSVYNLKVIPAAMGESSAEISFNAPTALINGELLTDPFKVNVYRNDGLVKEFEVTPGQAISWTDNTPDMGYNEYRFIGMMGDQEGLAASKNVWVGPDISEPVKNMTMKTVDGNMHVLLNWEAPEKGANGGYFNINDVTYTIWRSNGDEDFTPLKSNLKKLTYTDTQIEEELDGEQDIRYYAVTADTKSGCSEAEARYLVVGTPYKIPVQESFADGVTHIQPWTAHTLGDAFGWETIFKEDGGVYPQDNDRGMLRLYNWWGGYCDGRLTTPVLDFSGSRNPSFSFFMFHWNAADVEADNGQTKMIVEISVDGGEFQQIGEEITAGYERAGWVEHRISLAEFKDAQRVQIGLRGITDNSWMYYYVDNIHIEEQEEYDLAVFGFEGTKQVYINEEGTYKLRYFNRGLKAATGYAINLYQDGNMVQTLNGEEIQPGETKEIDMKIVLNASKAGKESAFYAEIVYDKDGNTENNQSATVNTTVNSIWYPVVEDLSGVINDDEVTLTWTAPVIPAEIVETEDGVEDYEPFAITSIGDWITYDGDRTKSGYLGDLPVWPHQGEDQAFQVWAFGYLEGADAKDFPALQPRTGEQCFISWHANENVLDADGTWYPAHNDDYLISPAVLGGSKVSFYIHRINEKTEGEHYQVMYSTTTQEPEAFKVLTEGDAGFDWEKVEVTLPADARYFAIHYITPESRWGILIDDITYTSGIFGLKIKGFNVYRDGKKLNDTLLTEPTFKDSNLPEGTHQYQVSVVYESGESEASEAVELSFSSGINDVEALLNVYAEGDHIVVVTENAQLVSIYTVDGKAVISRSVTGKAGFQVVKGMYIVKIGEKVTKVIVNE